MPLLGRRNDLLFPNVFAEHQKQILGFVFISQVQENSAAVEMEFLHARIEIDETDRHAGQADNRQAGLVALALDPSPLFDVDFQGIGEDIDGVETDLLGHANAVSGVAARLGPGGIDEAELHE